MTSKDKKAYLMSYRQAEERVTDLLNEKDRIMSLLTRVTPAGETGGGGDTDRIGSGVSKLIRLERDIDDEIDRLVDTKAQITAAIQSIGNPAYQRVLYLRYIQCYKWDTIADLMHYDVDAKKVYALHGRALEALKIGH